MLCFVLSLTPELTVLTTSLVRTDDERGEIGSCRHVVCHLAHFSCWPLHLQLMLARDPLFAKCEYRREVSGLLGSPMISAWLSPFDKYSDTTSIK